MPERTESARLPGAADIEAVRQALLGLHDGDELLATGEPVTGLESADTTEVSSTTVRRALVDELIGFLDAREDLIDLQVRSGSDPLELLLMQDVEENL